MQYNYDTDNSLLWKTGNLVESVHAFVSSADMFGTIQILTKEEGKEGSQKGNLS